MTIVSMLNQRRKGLLLKRQRNKNRLATLRTALQACSYQGLHAIHCQWEGRRLVLRGKVMSYFLKQTAQEMVFHHLGRIEIRNEIEVELAEHVTFLN